MSTLLAEPSTLEVANRVVYDMPAEEYHSPRLGIASKSALDQIARSPAHYRAWLETPREPTPAMVFGSLTHLYVFEPAKCLLNVVVEPSFGDCRTKLNKERRDVWREENKDKQWVSQEDWDKVRGIGDAVHKHPIAAKLISQCQAEVSCFWLDAQTGLECRARVDGWVPSMRIGLDLKTTSDASRDEFAKSVWNFRYMCQEAFYRDGIEAASKMLVKAFLFIAVEKEPPYAVATYTLDDAAVARGRELIASDMATLRRCIDEDAWPAYGESTQILSLPQWTNRIAS